MRKSLKEQAVKSTGWSAIERIATQGGSFLIQLLLARLLVPEDYGIIAMLAIFLQVAQVFIDSGFANALIKKLNCTDVDYSTVFFYNLGVSIGLYLLFFCCAPLVASFYRVPLLTEVMRVITITLIINALCIVQRTKLVKKIDFKTQTKISIISILVSGVLGIALAYKGFGVWALCAQTIVNAISQFVLLSLFVRWKPVLVFSKKSFREMFNYGSKILVASLIGVFYENLYTIVIGKRFDSKSLGLYSRAEQFVRFPSVNLGSIVSRVSLPVLSKIQNEDEKLTIAYRKIIKYTSFLIFPIMLCLLAVAEPFIMVALREKWIGTVPILQILCIGFMFSHLNSLNLNLLYVKGRTDLVLKLEVIKKSIAISILFLTMPFGIYAMCCGRSLYNIIAFFINTYYTNKLIGLGFWKQLGDIIPYLLASIGMALVIFCTTHYVNSYIIKLVLGVFIGCVTYIIEATLFFRPVLSETLFVLIKKKI